MINKFMYGVGRLRIGDKTLGYIQKDTFKMNGQAGTSAQIHAEQMPGVPVLEIPQTNGTIAPSCGLIEWDYEIMALLMGGTVKRDADNNAIGWLAPSGLVECRKPVYIETMSKKRISIFDALIQAFPDGGLDLTSVAQINTSIKPQIPADGSAPWSVDNILDAEWEQIMAEEAAKRKAANAPKV